MFWNNSLRFLFSLLNSGTDLISLWLKNFEPNYDYISKCASVQVWYVFTLSMNVLLCHSFSLLLIFPK